MSQQPFVVFATPTFERRPCVEYIVSLLQTTTMLTKAKIDHVTTLLGGDPYLAKVRNRLVGSFLNDHPKATDLFFLDDDIGWPPHKVMEFIERPEDVLVGVYPKKQDAAEFPVTLKLDADGAPIEKDGLYLGELVPTGFMRIKRHVLEKMAARSMKYHENSADGKSLVLWEIFQNRLFDLDLEALRTSDLDALDRDAAIAHLKRALGVAVGHQFGQWWGEDFYFVERWREMGGEVWVDPDIQFTHRGSKAWAANFMDSVRATLASRKPERRAA